MADASKREQTTAKATSPAAPAPTEGAKPSLGQRLAKALGPRPAAPGAAAQAKRQRGGMMRMMFGMLVFLVAAEFIGPAVVAIDQRLNLHLERVVVLPRGVPLLGGMTALLLVYFLIIVGIWIALLKLNIIPRDPLGTRAARDAARAQRTQQTTTLRNGPARTRAERRHAAAAATTSTTSKTSSAKGTAAKTSTAKTSTAKAASGSRGVAVASVATTTPSAHDDAYLRARAADRARRRKAARR
jgi:hypothetical protein